MSITETIHKQAVERILQELKEEGEYSQIEGQGYARRIFDDFLDRIAAKGILYVRSGGSREDIKEELIQDYRSGIGSLLKAFKNSHEFRDRLYRESYEALKALIDTGKSWRDLFTGEIAEDQDYLNEIFVRLVEEREEVEITSPEQLQELTGLFDQEYSEIEDTFIKAMYYRYFRTLENMLEAGAKYKDLNQISPKDFNLPDTWSGCLAGDQYSAILWAICLSFELNNEPGGLIIEPSLRAIAEELEAPYSVVMDAYNLTR